MPEELFFARDTRGNVADFSVFGKLTEAIRPIGLTLENKREPMRDMVRLNGFHWGRNDLHDHTEWITGVFEGKFRRVDK